MSHAATPFPRRMAVLTALASALSASYAHAAEPSTSTTDSGLPAIVITGRHYDNAVGSSDAASQGTIRADLLVNRPVLRPGEVLEWVPGMIVTQHSGDGKANQYFLRGFNLDHGTDFATTVDAMPVNMPTHGHGQGFSDLNFLIPELVDSMAYRKGPYFATHGDFATAGAADIVYKTHLDAPFVQWTLGQNGYRRAVGAATAQLTDDAELMGAVEWMGNDGPWVLPEALRRKNAVLRVSQGNRAQGGSLSFMAYDAAWNATDQVPQRLVDAGVYRGQPFSRFGTVDGSDGGSTSRYSLSGEWHRQTGEHETRLSAYAMRYALKLFSNFTYAMDRPDTGDQFSQQDERSVGGFKLSHAWGHALAGREARTEVGLQLRHDAIHVGLFDTQERQIIATTRLDDVRQSQIGAYVQNRIEWTPWLRTVWGLRADQARFAVDSLTHAANSGHTQASLLSPKLSMVLGPWQQTEFFFNAGRGFHSNDARGTSATQDPKTGEPISPVPGLVAAFGWELGVRTERIANLQSSLALWQLQSDSELVYVGDAGATEASFASRRWGIEWNNRWTPSPHVLLDADLALTQARFANGDHVPNAVESVASVALTLKDIGPWSASLQWRYLGSGALVEDNSVRSHPASTLNLRVSRDLRDWTGLRSTVSVDVFNVLNAEVNDIQYYYASQLPGESAPVMDRVVHPAEPLSVRVTYRINF